MTGPFYRGRFDRRGPRSGAPTPKAALMHAIASQSRALAWWPADQQFVHLTSGNVDTWTDYVGGKTLTDQGNSLYRPPWVGTSAVAPYLNFDGSRVLYGAANLIAGLGDVSWILVADISAAAGLYGFIASYNPSPNAAGNRSVVYQDVTSAYMGNYMEAAGVYQQMQTNTNPTGSHVWVARQKYADGGTAAPKMVRRDGSDIASTLVSTGNVTGGTYGNYSVAVGATGAGEYPATVKVTDLLVCPYLADADTDAVYQLLRQLRGLP